MAADGPAAALDSCRSMLMNAAQGAGYGTGWAGCASEQQGEAEGLQARYMPAFEQRW